VNGTPYTTFQTHITPVNGKRIELGSGMLKKPPPPLDSRPKEVAVDVLIRKG